MLKPHSNDAAKTFVWNLYFVFQSESKRRRWNTQLNHHQHGWFPSFNADFELRRGLPHCVFITVHRGIKSNVVTPRLTSSGLLNTSREFTIEVSSDSDSDSVLTCSPRGFDLTASRFQSPLAFKDFVNSTIRHRASNSSIRFRRDDRNRYWINLLLPLQPLQFSFSPSLFFDVSEDYCCSLFNTGWRLNESLLWNEDELKMK